MKYRYRGLLPADLVFRDDTSFDNIQPKQVIDAPYAVNNALFEPLDAEAQAARVEHKKDWDEWPDYPDAAPAAPAVVAVSSDEEAAP